MAKAAKNDLPGKGKIAAEIKTIFEEAYPLLQQIEQVIDSKFAEAIAEMLMQESKHYCTQEFLKRALRQGCAYDFDELKPPEKDPWLLQCKDPKTAVCKYFL